jgi:hypothetical protein
VGCLLSGAEHDPQTAHVDEVHPFEVEQDRGSALAMGPQALAEGRRAGQVQLAEHAHADSSGLAHLNHFQHRMFATQRACSFGTGLTAVGRGGDPQLELRQRAVAASESAPEQAYSLGQRSLSRVSTRSG